MVLSQNSDPEDPERQLREEELLSLPAEARILPRRRGDKKVPTATLYRWIKSELKGVVLKSLQVGGTCCSKPKATIAPNGARTSFVCNKLGSQIRTTGPTGAISTTVYDVLNRTVGSIDPLG